MEKLKQNIDKFLLPIVFCALLSSCSQKKVNSFGRSIIKEEVQGFDSIVEITFNGGEVAKEFYKKNSIFKIEVQNDSIAFFYYKGYFGLRELGVDLFTAHCSSCHLWYPDFKNERDYAVLDSSKYMSIFYKNEKHRNIGLSNLELIAIGNYLHLMGQRQKVIPTN